MEEESNFISLSSLKVEELLEKAETFFEEMCYEKAKAFYQEAYIKAPDNEDLLCSYANFLTNIEEIPLARKVLRSALKLNITNSLNYKKFLQMAELVDGKLSSQLYEKAIEILNKLYNPIVDYDIFQNEIKRDLANAYCGLAEVYQTDLLQYKESEELCRKNIEKALEIDEKCLDAYLQFANFWLNKEDIEEARKWLGKLVKEIRNAEKLENDDNEENDEIEEKNEKNTEKIEEEKHEKKSKEKLKNGEKLGNPLDFYPISFKVNVSKVLIEVEDYETAIELLEGYYDENAENIEALYLLAFCSFKAKNYLRCEEIMKELGLKDLSGDEELVAGFRELLQEMKKIDMGEARDRDEEGKEGEEDWMDVE